MGGHPLGDSGCSRRRSPLIAFVDTNVLIRHLTGDPPDHAARARTLLREARRLFLTDLILAEVAYVLESFYETARPQVAQSCRSIIAFPAIATVDPERLLRTIEVYEIHRIDFQDAYLVACAESSGVGVVASFDRDFDKVATIRRHSPGS